MTDTGCDAPGNEAERRQVLELYPLDGLTAGPELDSLAQLAAQVCEAPVGLVGIVEADREVFIGRSGTGLSEVPRQHSFCALAMHHAECMTVRDTHDDPRFGDHPLVTGGPLIRFYAGQPLVSPEGTPLGSLCVIDTRPREDLSPSQYAALKSVATAVMALLERARIEEHSRRTEVASRHEINDLAQRFELLSDAMPQLVWSTDPKGRAIYFNRGWCEFTGESPEASYGVEWMKLLHPEDEPHTKRVWWEAVASGGPYEVEYRLRHHDGGYRWVLARGLPMRDRSGTVTRWIGTCTDINEQKKVAERLKLLSRELNHRIKNIFAVLGGLIAMTMRSSPELIKAGQELQARVLALGRAHDFVRSDAEGKFMARHSSLQGMLEDLLAPYQDPDRQRITIVGEDFPIDDRSATPLALFFHELATNAAKYGALSDAGGHIEIRVEVGDQVHITWGEHGGPSVVPAAQAGFGAQLVEMSISRQLGGTLKYDWSAEGLQVTASIPGQSMIR